MAENLYKELSAGYQFTRNVRGGPTGRRWFQRNDATGTIAQRDLPQPGLSQMVDENGKNVFGCYATSSTIRYASGHGATPIYEVQYGPLGLSGEVTHGTAESVRFDVGTEQVLLPAERFKWHTSINPIPFPIGVGVTTGSITKLKSGLTKSQDTQFRIMLIERMQTLNSKDFEGFAAGNVKFEGAYGSSYRDHMGKLRFSYELMFAFRVLPVVDGTAPTWAWQRELNVHDDSAFRAPEWELVYSKSGTKLRYKMTNFDDLFDFSGDIIELPPPDDG